MKESNSQIWHQFDNVYLYQSQSIIYRKIIFEKFYYTLGLTVEKKLISEIAIRGNPQIRLMSDIDTGNAKPIKQRA